MALRFPFILNGVKFQINPKNIKVSKPVTVADLATQGGVRFQIWYDTPEVLTIAGVSAGDTALRELLFLKENFEKTSTERQSELFYKTKVYRGFIRRLEVGHDLNEHLRFPYTIEFQLLHGERFKIEDFALNPTGLLSAPSRFITEKVGAPIARAEKALSRIFGKVI